MNTINRTYVLIFSLITLFFITVSCDDDETISDTTPPSIHLISPAEGDVLIIGDEKGIYFKAEFSDNVKLSSYSVDIHSSKGHSHAKTRSEHTHEHDDKDSEDNTFKFKRPWNLPETQEASVEHREIIIPEGVEPGAYHFVVFCLDALGNESYIAKNITLVER